MQKSNTSVQIFYFCRQNFPINYVLLLSAYNFFSIYKLYKKKKKNILLLFL